MANLPPLHDPAFGSEAYQVDLYAHYREYLTERPVFRNSEGVVYVTRHADCTTLLGGKQFKRVPPGGGSPFGHAHDDPSAIDRMIRHWMIFMDPPRHDIVRKAFALPFAPAAVERLEPFIREKIVSLLEGLPNEGEVELLDSFSFPIPILVVAEILGVPTNDLRLFQQWSAQLTRALDSATPETFEQGTETATALNRYFGDLLKDADKLPEHCLIRMLRDDPEHRLSSEEIISGLIFILLSGHETTKNLISNGLLLLAQHPASLRALRANPAGIATAVEEVLRYDTPTQKFGRWTHEEAEFGGFTIPTGTFMTAMMGAANRDPLVFDEPDRFDITRSPNRHMAFGIGLHRCLGSSLARLEGRLAFEAFLPRVAELAPVEHHWRTFSAFRSMDRLRLRLTPAR